MRPDTLRLLLFEQCNRSCEGCCNKDWDLDNLPVAPFVSYKNYDKIVLTGGEPMLRPDLVKEVATRIRIAAPNAKIILYTAKTRPLSKLMDVLRYIDGVTVTLHEQADLEPFLKLKKVVDTIWSYGCTSGEHRWVHKLSFRLNVFSNVILPDVFISGLWDVRRGYEWIKNCPLPSNEDFMRLERRK